MEEVLLAVKAIQDGDDWVLDVLGVPFGGPKNGRDSQGERFTPDTDLWLKRIPKRPVVYYHGLDEKDRTPQIIGEELSWEIKADGVWFRVLLDKASKMARRVWEAAQLGLARASSGAISHLVRSKADGTIITWPIGELSLLDSRVHTPVNAYAIAVPTMKAIYQQAGLDLPDNVNLEADEREEAEGLSGQSAKSKGSEGKEKENNKEKDVMSEDNTGLDEARLEELIAKRVQDGLAAAKKAEEDAKQEEEERQAAIKAEVEKQVEERTKELEEEAIKANRLSFNGENAPVVGQFGDLRKFDELDAADQAVMITVLKSAGAKVSEAAYKALNVKLHEANGNEGAANQAGYAGRAAMKAVGMPDMRDAKKANEINYSTLASYGDDWVVTANSAALWETIRTNVQIAQRIPSIVVPQGAEAVLIPLESTDPVFYKVAQATSDAASGGLSRPDPTVTSSRLGTANNTLTVSKMGARTRWTGEMQEDSIVPFANQLRNQLSRAGSETFEHTIIDGDTATAASTNINDIGNASAQGGTEVYLLYNGFRKSPLVTTTANSRSGGALDELDYLETMKLLGAAGKHAVDKTKAGFIIDPNVNWKSLEIDAIKTRDVFVNPTIENGMLTGIWGWPVLTSYFMHWVARGYGAQAYKTNAAGKIDQDTTANNTKGSILAVRWDQWLLGFKRRMTMETVRHPEWDGWEITSLMRVGLLQRDTEGVASTYNLTV
jgi:hypothetical protein